MCEYKPRYGRIFKCPHPDYGPGKDRSTLFCIFHSDMEDKDAAKFYKGFKKLYKSGKHDFRGFVFPKGFDFRRLEEETEPLKFVDAVFSEAHFLCDVNLFGSEFTGEGGTNFTWAKFSGEGGTDFSEAKFSEKSEVDFSESYFNAIGNILFKGTDFSTKGLVSFKEARFEEKGAVIFEGANFSKDTIVDFRKVTTLDTRRLTLEDVYVGRWCFLGTYIRHFDFREVSWKKVKDKYDSGSRKKRNMVFDDFLLTNEIEKILKDLNLKENREHYEKIFNEIKDDLKGKHYEVSRLYGQLQIKYDETKRYHESGDFFAGQMEMRKNGEFENRIIRRLILPAYKLISLYGERPIRAFGWILILIVAASFLSLVVGIEPLQPDLEKIKLDTLSFTTLFTREFWNDYLEALYVSLNILTLGKVKSVYTIGHSIWGLLLNTSVVVFGATFFSLFILAMNRKFRRTKD